MLFYLTCVFWKGCCLVLKCLGFYFVFFRYLLLLTILVKQYFYKSSVLLIIFTFVHGPDYGILPDVLWLFKWKPCFLALGCGVFESTESRLLCLDFLLFQPITEPATEGSSLSSAQFFFGGLWMLYSGHTHTGSLHGH